MAGYSATPLIKKLGIKPDDKVLFINEPAIFYKDLGVLPEELNKVNNKTHFDYIHFFTKDKDDLEKFFKEIPKHLGKNGMLWISWPKKSAKVETDIDENIIREIGLAAGLVDVKVAAIDDTWSGLKFVFRLKDR